MGVPTLLRLRHRQTYTPQTPLPIPLTHHLTCTYEAATSYVVSVSSLFLAHLCWLSLAQVCAFLDHINRLKHHIYFSGWPGKGAGDVSAGALLTAGVDRRRLGQRWLGGSKEEENSWRLKTHIWPSIFHRTAETNRLAQLDYSRLVSSQSLKSTPKNILYFEAEEVHFIYTIWQEWYKIIPE